MRIPRRCHVEIITGRQREREKRERRVPSLPRRLMAGQQQACQVKYNHGAARGEQINIRCTCIVSLMRTVAKQTTQAKQADRV
jgi:hypothetical protein